LDNLVQVINQAPGARVTGDAFIAADSQYLDPKQFPTYGATEQVLAGTTLYYFLPWDKDMTIYGWSRDIMDGISNGPTINLLAKRLVAIPQYQQVYLNALVKAATLMGGAGGWADSEIAREYGVIHAAALDDPNQQCMNAGVLNSRGNLDFEGAFQRVQAFLASRSSLVLFQVANAGQQASQASKNGPRIAATGISTLGGLQALSPGGLRRRRAAAACTREHVRIRRRGAIPAAFDGNRQH
jgi:hypothetical protein